jgi:hypothetical protein
MFIIFNVITGKLIDTCKTEATAKLLCSWLNTKGTPSDYLDADEEFASIITNSLADFDGSPSPIIDDGV